MTFFDFDDCFALQLDAPLFITWYQCVVSLVVLFFLSLLGDKYPAIDKFPVFQINPEICKQVRYIYFETPYNLFYLAIFINPNYTFSKRKL